MPLKRKHHSLFYGWWVVVACLLITAYIGGVIWFGFTAVFKPIADEFGWSYTQVSIAASLRGVEMGLFAPLIGFLVDRWGPRKLIFSGTIIIGLGMILLSYINSLIMYYAAFLLIAVGMSLCSPTVMMTTVVNWFRKKLAIASGIVVSGAAVAGLLVPLVSLLTDGFGWRAAMMSLGLGILVMALPLSLLIRNKPEQYGSLPDGETSRSVIEDEVLAPPPDSGDVGGRQAVKSRAFWHISLAMMLSSLLVSAVVTHVMPYLSSVGIVRSVSSLMAGMLPLTSILGRLGFGWLGDKLNKRWLIAVAFCMMASGLLLYGNVTAGLTWLLVPSIVLFSTGWGGHVTMRVALLREYFGRGRFGSIMGLVMGIGMVGHIVGAPLAGWVFDRWGSYHGIWLAFVGLAVVAIVIVLTLPAIKKSS